MRLPTTAVSILLSLLFSGVSTESSAPASQNLHKLYGEPTIEFFDVGSGVSIAVEYGSDRAACELLVGPKQSLIERQDPNQAPISSKIVSDILQEWVPDATRGRLLTSNSVQIGGDVQLKTDYENVSIRRLCSASSCVSTAETQDLRTLVVFKRNVCPTHF